MRSPILCEWPSLPTLQARTARRIARLFCMSAKKPIPKSTLSQHFKALREAGLIRGERRGVEMHNTSRCAEIDKRFPGLIMAIVNAHKIQLQEKTGAGKRRRPARRSTKSK